MPKADITVENHGSIFLFRPRTQKIRKQLARTVQDGAMWFAGALAVEPRFAYDLAENLTNDGFTLA
jgi:hypothetical protein